MDDSTDDVDLIVESLAEYRGTVDIDIARDGQEAIDYLHRQGKFSPRAPNGLCLVLLDIKMPKVDGIEVLRVVKSDRRTRSIPVVVFTSSREPQDLREGYRYGANAYVVKPIAFDEFSKTMTGIGSFWLDLNEPPPRA